MAWTTPRTWVTGERVTAAIMNTHVKDNFAETCAATVTTAGDLTYADAGNSMGSRLAIAAAGSHLASTGSAPVWRTAQSDANYSDGSTSGSTVNTSYSNTFTGPISGPRVLNAQTSTHALVVAECQSAINSGANEFTYISYSVSDATTIAADDSISARFETPSANIDSSLCHVSLLSTLTAGQNDFSFNAKVSGGTATITRPRLIVFPL